MLAHRGIVRSIAVPAWDHTFPGPPHQRTVFTVKGKDTVEARQIDAGLGHQGGQPGDEIQRLKDDVRGPNRAVIALDIAGFWRICIVTVRTTELLTHPIQVAF